MSGVREAATGKTAPTFQDRLEFAIFSAALWFFATLPRRWSLRIGAWLGEAFYLLDWRDRRIALINLAIAYPDRSLAERKRILRASCRNLGRTGAEIAWLPALRRETLGEFIAFADRDTWNRAVRSAEPHGGIVLTAHFGNWELLAYVHGLLGHPITLIHRPMRNTLVDAAIEGLRGAVGTRALRKKAAAREALQALRAGQILVIPSDQNQTARYGVFVRLFGKLACTTPGAARLAARTGAPIVPVFLVREGESDRHRIEVLPPIELVSSGDREADAVINTQRCSDAVEAMILRYPEQWIWFHKRFKTRPPGEPKLYS